MPLGFETIHDINDDAKVSELVASMQAKGWVGMPIVIWDDKALTGVHRIAAAEIAEIRPETIDLADVFAEDGADFDEAVEAYQYAQERNAEWTAGLDTMYGLLSAATRDKYGIQY